MASDARTVHVRSWNEISLLAIQWVHATRIQFILHDFLQLFLISASFNAGSADESLRAAIMPYIGCTNSTCHS